MHKSVNVIIKPVGSECESSYFDPSLCECLIFLSLSPPQLAMQTLEDRGAESYVNGCAGHMNGSEPTKMKEVAFEKNPSEPMVCSPPRRPPVAPRLDASRWLLSCVARLQGVTLKLNEKQRCAVARILHGGMIHRQGDCLSFLLIYDSDFGIYDACLKAGTGLRRFFSNIFQVYLIFNFKYSPKTRQKS